MKIDSQIERLLDESQNAHRCAVTTDVNLRRKLRRRCESGELTMPYPQLFARTEIWAALNPRERKRRIILALAMLRSDWIFCAQSAACLYGIEQSYQIHDNPMIHIASTHESGIYRAKRSDAVIHRVYTPNLQYNVINGAKVTTLPCTIYQCALVLPFEQILPLADSAVRSGMALDDLRQFPVHSAAEALAIGNVLEYTDPRSENSGETLARSRFIERGLMIPQLQKEFPNPQNPEYPFRVDFIWILPDGRMTVAEYDGMAKYGNDRKTIANHVHREKLAMKHCGNTVSPRSSISITRICSISTNSLPSSSPPACRTAAEYAADCSDRSDGIDSIGGIACGSFREPCRKWRLSRSVLRKVP